MGFSTYHCFSPFFFLFFFLSFLLFSFFPFFFLSFPFLSFSFLSNKTHVKCCVLSFPYCLAKLGNPVERPLLTGAGASEPKELGVDSERRPMETGSAEGVYRDKWGATGRQKTRKVHFPDSFVGFGFFEVFLFCCVVSLRQGLTM